MIWASQCSTDVNLLSNFLLLSQFLTRRTLLGWKFNSSMRWFSYNDHENKGNNSNCCEYLHRKHSSESMLWLDYYYCWLAFWRNLPSICNITLMSGRGAASCVWPAKKFLIISLNVAQVTSSKWLPARVQRYWEYLHSTCAIAVHIHINKRLYQTQHDVVVVQNIWFVSSICFLLIIVFACNTLKSVVKWPLK